MSRVRYWPRFSRRLSRRNVVVPQSLDTTQLNRHASLPRDIHSRHSGAQTKLGTLGLWLAAAVLLVGCGPITYVNQVTRRASAQVASAKSAQADKYAPYWYTLAVEYLHKAREEAASADYEAANRLGRRSEQAAKLARKYAIERAADPAFQPVKSESDQTKESERLAPLEDDEEPRDPDSNKDDKE